MDRCAQADLEAPDFARFPKLKARLTASTPSLLQTASAVAGGEGR